MDTTPAPDLHTVLCVCGHLADLHSAAGCSDCECVGLPSFAFKTGLATFIEAIRQDTLRFAEDEARAIDTLGQTPRSQVSDIDWLRFCANHLNSLRHDDRLTVADWLRFQREGLPENAWVIQRRLAREAEQQAD